MDEKRYSDGVWGRPINQKEDVRTEGDQLLVPEGKVKWEPIGPGALGQKLWHEKVEYRRPLPDPGADTVASKEMRSVLLEYLNYSSTDGKIARQKLRERLRTLANALPEKNQLSAPAEEQGLRETAETLKEWLLDGHIDDIPDEIWLPFNKALAAPSPAQASVEEMAQTAAEKFTDDREYQHIYKMGYIAAIISPQEKEKQ